MAKVFAGVGDYLARSRDIEIEPVLDDLAEQIESFALGLASEHVKSRDYIDSLQVGIDRSSPSGRDRFVFSDDPGALAIEYGHREETEDGSRGEFVGGQYILTGAAAAARLD